jgi:hypothetical protein
MRYQKITIRLILKSHLRTYYFKIRTKLKLGKIIRMEETQKKIETTRDNISSNLTKLPSNNKVIFGPWMGELGFEILYWAPLVYSLAKEDCAAISRGGVDLLYPNCDYLEIYEYIDIQTWNEIQISRYEILGGEKQREWLPKEISLVQTLMKSKNNENLGTSDVLHPKNMFEKYNFSNSQELCEQESLLMRFSENIRNNISVSTEARENNEKNALLATYTRKGLYSEDVKSFYQSAFFQDAFSLYKLKNLENNFEDLQHQFVPHPNFETPITANNIISINLENKIKQIKESDFVITTDGGLAYLSILLGKDTFAIRGKGDYWSKHHTNLASRLASNNKVRYDIISFDKPSNWFLIEKNLLI